MEAINLGCSYCAESAIFFTAMSVRVDISPYLLRKKCWVLHEFSDHACCNSCDSREIFVQSCLLQHKPPEGGGLPGTSFLVCLEETRPFISISFRDGKSGFRRRPWLGAALKNLLGSKGVCALLCLFSNCLQPSLCYSSLNYMEASWNPALCRSLWNRIHSD